MKINCKTIYSSSFNTESGKPIMITAYAFVIKEEKHDEYRQATKVLLSVNGQGRTGLAVLNPTDIYHEEKGIKQAIRKAMNQFPKEGRKEIWEAILEDLAFRAVVQSSIMATFYELKYGNKDLLDRLRKTELTINES